MAGRALSSVSAISREAMVPGAATVLEHGALGHVDELAHVAGPGAWRSCAASCAETSGASQPYSSAN
jgi:hypothetical protein